MTWFKLDDNAVDHPKLASLSDRAFRWWVRGLSYASRFLTDGFLPEVFWKQVPKTDRAELTKQRLWDWIDPSFLIHDYHHHQSKREDVEADKERNREKSRAFRERRKAERRKVTGDVTDRVTGDDAGTSNRLVTDPHTHTHTHNREEPKDRAARSDRFDEWWSAYPKKTGKGAALKAWGRIRPSSDTVTKMLDAIVWQMNQPQWAKDGGAYIPNPATYLNQSRWEDEPFHTTLKIVPMRDDSALDAALQAVLDREEAKKTAGGTR